MLIILYPKDNSVNYKKELAVDYKPVAFIEEENLNKAFEFMNHHTDDDRIKEVRSMSIGDIIITAKGDAYMVDGVGWKQVKANCIGMDEIVILNKD